MTDDRVPPYDQGAERAILGAALLDNSTIDTVAPLLRPDDFYVTAHRVLWCTMQRLRQDRTPVDHVTVGAALKASGQLDQIGGAMAMSNLTEGVGTTSTATYYANIVARLAALRRLLYTCHELAASVHTCGTTDPRELDECLADARTRIIDATLLALAGKGPRPDSEDLDAVLHQLEKGGNPPGLVHTNMRNIDSLLGGLWPGLLTVCAARPSMGKSAFALAVAGNVARCGLKPLYLTLEDTRHFVVLRRLARFSGVDLTDLTLRRVRQTDWPRIIAAAEIIHRAPVQVDDSAGLSASAINQIATSQRVNHGLDLLIVDHLGEVAGDDKDSMFETTTKAARALRDLAKTMNIPVLLMAQLNRKVEERSDKRPQLSDLRQSGEIEQMARNVWFLFRRGYYLPDAANDHDLQLIVGKQAHGPTGMIELWCDLPRMDVRDWDLDQDGEFPKYRPHGGGTSPTRTSPPRNQGAPRGYNDSPEGEADTGAPAQREFFDPGGR